MRIARSELAAHLRGRGALVGFLEWDVARGKGIDDHLALVGPETVLDEVAHVDFAGSAWRKDLLRSKPPMNTTEGRILPILANAIAAFRHAPEWGGVLAFNEFGYGTVALKPAPWGVVPKGEWTDHEDRLAAEWLQKQGVLVSVEVAGQAVQTAARDRPFHPVKTYLQGLQWDGVERIASWLSTYLGAEDTEYSRAVGSRWLISAIARIFRPGAKADCCLILEGPQGIRKSTALRTLAGDYFTDELADLGSKDAAMQIRGVWIIELSELDSLSHSEVARIKAFMSRTTDRFRPPYGMRLVESPRQCIFAGTVNHSTYLRDETGGRRFWPIACGRIDVDALARDRDQLWAEAKARFESGAVWWLETADLVQMASDQQIDRYEGDPWEEVIGPWVESRTSVSISEVLEKCLQKGASTMDADRQEPCRTLPPGSGLGALPGATRGAPGMAVSQRNLISSQLVPGVFFVMFPPLAPGKRPDQSAVPSVPRVSMVHVRITQRPPSNTTIIRNRGTVGTRPRMNGFDVNVAGTNRGTAIPQNREGNAFESERGLRSLTDWSRNAAKEIIT